MNEETRTAFTPEEEAAESGRGKRGRSVVLFFVVLVLLLGGLSAVYAVFFRVETVIASPSTHYASEELIAAAGIPEKTRLYSFSSLDVEANIKRACPYVLSVSVKRVMPDRVEITVTEDSAVFYGDVFGETWLFSGSLRVLENVGEEIPEGCIRLKLPPIENAVAGETLVFRDRDMNDYAEEVLSAVREAALFTRMNWVDLRDENELVMVCDSLYLLKFGTAEDVDIKLRVAETVLRDEVFKGGSRARIDLSKACSATKETSVILDNELDLEL